MKYSRITCWIVVVILLFVFLFEAAGYIAVWTTPPPPMRGESLFLNDEEVVILEHRAKDEGDWVSAQLLARFYGAYLHQPEKAKYFQNIANEARKQNRRK